METLKATWWEYGSEDDHELVRELLDDESPFFLSPEETLMESLSAGSEDEQAINQLLSTVYSGPTIQDIENALSVTSREEQSQLGSQTRLSLFERGTSKIENNKYTLKLKSSGNGMVDDGYKWRKYGQKSIKNSPYPRSYYRCTNSRCNAKKQVERSSDDHDTLIITYEGLHLHFAYPYFLLDQPEDGNPPTKKPKRTSSEAQEFQPHSTQQIAKNAQEGSAQDSSISLPPSRLEDDYMKDSSPVGTRTQGLLEDVVPLMVRNPSNYNVPSNWSCDSSSHRSPSTSSSSLSWSPNNSHI
ncbi:hypothetical protein Tsubulata_045007 [Turnera subulata]|uniref:WRKY domain-containing protein n=1 Tax=Turnera subulata TaxID=218843 RepID=A0A9Q0F3S3_9ROSI|nr:hypothetical protein Tsubulata_045007 [Turnera subulata]